LFFLKTKDLMVFFVQEEFLLFFLKTKDPMVFS